MDFIAYENFLTTNYFQTMVLAFKYLNINFITEILLINLQPPLRKGTN